MMKTLGRIAIGAVAGAVVGGLIGWFGVLFVLGLLYSNLEQGALVVLQTAPIGALIGALIGSAIAGAWGRAK